MRKNKFLTTRFWNKFSFIILIVLAVILAFSLVRSVDGVRYAGVRVREQEERVERIRSEREELEERLDSTLAEEFVEKQLRDKLGLAREGEIIVILPDPEVVRKFAPKVAVEEDALPDPNWKKWAQIFKLL